MNYKNVITSIVLFFFTSLGLNAQVKIESYIYHTRDYDSDDDTKSVVTVDRHNNQLTIYSNDRVGQPIPGYCVETTYVDYDADSIYYEYLFDDTLCYFSTAPLTRNDIKWDTQQVDSRTTRYVTSINSNRIELLFRREKSGANVNPLPYYGHFDGVLQEMVRNGLTQIKHSSTSKATTTRKEFIANHKGTRKTAREIGNIKRERMVLTTHVFDDEQICWGKEKPTLTDIPFDTTLHYAGGTVILKRMMLPKLPKHYQTFVELRQRSNGDAYDRTGSLFVIPNAEREDIPTFLDAIIGCPDSLPIITGKDGERYQGIVPGLSPMKKYSPYLQPTSSNRPSYYPPVELMRFFTPFGVGKFNDRVKLDGLEWEDETFYKQEVTELQPLLEGEVWIGCFIGNYDGGGHKVSLDIKSYPNDYEWTEDKNDKRIFSLINTCNVLEMAGQNYGKIFGTDSITVTFWVADTSQHTTLRYISTGHGGWDGGDEFNPKENEIFIDGVKRFSHTPWRCDCGRYREWNPVSGNFWNGLSSSDLSRSGWCPGTATQPVYFDLGGLERGNHTLTIAIPQGKAMEEGFSHWNVSAVLIVNCEL